MTSTRAILVDWGTKAWLERVQREWEEATQVSIKRWLDKKKKCGLWGTWVVQSVKHLTSALNPTLGSMLTARSLEPALDSISPSRSLPLPHLRSVSLSQK